MPCARARPRARREVARYRPSPARPSPRRWVLTKSRPARGPPSRGTACHDRHPAPHPNAPAVAGRRAARPRPDAHRPPAHRGERPDHARPREHRGPAHGRDDEVHARQDVPEDREGREGHRQREGRRHHQGRTVTLPIDTSTTITLSPGTADILAKGTLLIRRKDGRKVVSQDITLRLRDTGADVGGTLRGRPQRQFSALTISPTTAVQQIENGYKFVDIQMLVSSDFASAAKRAKLKALRPARSSAS